MQNTNNKKTYFASDFHLGIDGRMTSREREKQIVRWLEEIKDQAEAIYLVGDVFDFWFEYKRVVPKGYVRLLGKLAELRDAGIELSFFTGNHDMWMFEYFQDELGIQTYRAPIERDIGGKRFVIGHGDGLGPGDHGYKVLKKVFANRACQWLFERLHPNLGIWLADFWSAKSRASNKVMKKFLGDEGEWLITYCNEYLATKAVDYFIFGHRHIPIDHTLKDGKSRYINLGDWVNYNSYAVFDGHQLSLNFYENEHGRVYGNNGY